MPFISKNKCFCFFFFRGLKIIPHHCEWQILRIFFFRWSFWIFYIALEYLLLAKYYTHMKTEHMLNAKEVVEEKMTDLQKASNKLKLLLEIVVPNCYLFSRVVRKGVRNNRPVCGFLK